MTPHADPSSHWREKRRWPRRPLSTSAVLIDTQGACALKIRDVSAGGIAVYAGNRPPVGEPVGIELVLGLDQRFALRGTVVRHDAESFAVEFSLNAIERLPLARALPLGDPQLAYS